MTALPIISEDDTVPESVTCPDDVVTEILRADSSFVKLNQGDRMSFMDKLRELFGGKPKGPAQHAGERIDQATEKASASAKAGERISEAGEKLKSANE